MKTSIRFSLMIMAALLLSVAFSFNRRAFAQGGTLEVANCDQISGWAWDIQHVTPMGTIFPLIPKVTVSDSNSTMGEAYAIVPRFDLPAADKSRHGFWIPTPENLKDGRPHSIRVSSEVGEMAGSPKTLTCGELGANLTYTMDMLFKTQNQSMWNSDQVNALSWSSGEAMYIPWELRDKSDDSYKEIKVGGGSECVLYLTCGLPLDKCCKHATIPGKSLGTFGARGDADTVGKMGLRIEAKATAGSVDINAPVKVKFSYPADTPAGSFFAVNTSYYLDPRASTMNTFSPNASAKLFIFADGNFGAGAKVKGFGKDLFVFSIPSKDFKVDAEVFDTTAYVNEQLAERSYEHGEPAVDFRATLRFPVINTSGGPESPTTLSSTGHDWMVSMTGRLTSILTNSLNKAGVPMPPLSMALTLPYDKVKNSNVSVEQKNPDRKPYSADLQYDILQADVTGTLGLQQDFKFTPKPMITLVAKDSAGTTLTAYKDRNGAQPLNFPVVAGTQVWYKMSPSGLVTITPSVAYDGDFSNKTSIRLTGSIDFDPLVFEITGRIGMFPASRSIPGFKWRAVDTLGKEFPLLLPPQEFKPRLGGWGSPVTGPPFSVVTSEAILATITSLDKVVADVGTPTDVMATSAKADWDMANTKFYWDTYDPVSEQGRGLDGAPSQSPKEVKLTLTREMLTPGMHKIIAVATGVSGGTKFKRTSSVDFRVAYPKPTLTALKRGNTESDSILAGSPATQFSLEGTGFNSLSKVYIDGRPLKAQKIIEITPTNIRFTAVAVLLDDPNTFDLTVANPLPGGGISNEVKLTVASSIPTIRSIEDNGKAVMGGGDAPLRITGTNFVPSSAIEINGKRINTFFVSKTVVSGRIPRAMLDRSKFDLETTTAKLPTLAVTVTNPTVTSAKGVKTGGASKPSNLEIKVPPPDIDELEPSRVAVGSPDLELTITGTNFLPGSALLVKDQGKPNAPPTRYNLTYVSPTKMKATLPAALLKNETTLELNIVNKFFPTPIPQSKMGFEVTTESKLLAEPNAP